MNRKGGKPGPRKPALRLGLDFWEALQRFIATDAKELEAELAKAAAVGPPPPTRATAASPLRRKR